MSLFDHFPPHAPWTTTEKLTDNIQSLFSRVTNSYDMMNDIMSLGIHRFWKKHFVAQIALSPGNIILDVASGTGDIAQNLIKNYRFLDLKVLALDLTPSMIQTGKERAVNKGVINGIDYIVGNAEMLPLPDESVDVYLCAYGMRNMENLPKALEEAYRVLKKGQTFYCLEFSAVEKNFLKPFYDFYLLNVIPKFGEHIANDAKAYQYLVDSIRAFPSQENFKKMIEEAGFMNVSFENLSYGVTSIHKGVKA